MSGRALEYVLSTRWCMRPDVLQQLGDVLVRHQAGIRAEQSEIDAIVANRRSRAEARGAAKSDDPNDPRPLFTMHQGIAVIPITGILARHSSQVNGQSQAQGTSLDRIQRSIKAAREENPDAILFDIDSPGGSTDGLTETGDLIARTTQEIPTFALVDQGYMCSAALWLGVQAGRVMTTRAAEIGSIGTMMVVYDESEAAAQAGVKVHVITSTEHKTPGGMVAGTEVTEPDLEIYQDRVDDIGALFVEAVRRGRGFTAEHALEVADGRVHFAPRAKTLGLVDDIVRDFDHAIQKVASSVRAVRREASAAAAQAVAAPTHDDTNSDDAARPESRSRSAATSSVSPTKDTMTTPTKKPTYASVDEFLKAEPEFGAEVLAVGARQERARITAIQGLAVDGQEALIDECIRAGIDEDEARKRFHDDLKARQTSRADAVHNERAEHGTPPNDGGGNDDVFDDYPATAGANFEERALANWKANKDACRSRHSTFATYMAYLENEESLNSSRNQARRQRRAQRAEAEE